MEGVEVVMLRLRKPAGAMELHDWQAPDLVPLNAALNEVWTRWDQERIRLANDLAVIPRRLPPAPPTSPPGPSPAIVPGRISVHFLAPGRRPPRLTHGPADGEISGS